MFEREIHLNSELKLVYCDEDRIELSTNARSCPIFKPEFSPLLLSQKNYVGNCFLIRAGIEEFLSFVREKQCSEGFLESVLQSMRSQLSCANVLRIPSILFHDIAPTCPEPKSLTLIRDDALPGFSIIIPTRDKIEYLQPCIESIEGRSDYPAQKIEIIIVDNGSVELDTLSYLRALQTSGRAIVIRDDDKFNYSRLNNIAAARAAHEALLLLNNDTVVEDPLWLRRVATHVVEPDVGVVGAKLLFPDRTVQHGGVYLGIQGVAAHNLVGVNWNDPQLKLDLSREMSAVTGACLAIRRDVFFELGGLDENLPVAFNDTLLCLASLKAGYRNIYVREPLLIHFESKSRGYDDTPERKAAFQLEARYARSRFNEYFREDPFYSPNLCLQRVNELAYPPRKIKPWRTSRRNIDELKILFLSNVHGLGSGVAVVISLQAKHLSECGHKVYIGGPKGENEIAYEGCSRVILSDPEEAAAFAVREGIDCIVVETPPFFSVVRWLADWPRTLFLDHGEPPPDFFPDADNRKDVNFEKHFCFPLATATYAISESVRAEGGNGCAGIIRNANSHLGIWKDTLAGRRDEIRATYGWTHKTVVLNVCRIGRGERFYKGLDEYAFVLDELQRAKPELASSVVFVLCGKGAERDVVEMRQLGLEVFANVSDSKMIEMYLAADVYANFSRWEGYNLGIGQALAMGLPTIASDIPAHRAFPIFTSDDVGVIVEKLAELIQGIVSGGFRGTRKPIVTDWRNSLAVLEQSIIEICRSRVT
jgi:GT2 family glycosyltransferase